MTLIGQDTDQIADAQRELSRIGVDHLVGRASGDIAALTGGSALRSYRVVDFGHLAAVLAAGADVTVLDVRQSGEFADGHVRGAVNVALHDLMGALASLPAEGEVWIHCASGYRASVAASLLDREGLRVVLIDDGFDHAAELGLVTTAQDDDEPVPSGPAGTRYP